MNATCAKCQFPLDADAFCTNPRCVFADSRQGAKPAQNTNPPTSGQVHPEIEPDLAEQHPQGLTFHYEGDDPCTFINMAAKMGLGRTRVIIHVPPEKLETAMRFKDLRR